MRYIRQATLHTSPPAHEFIPTSKETSMMRSHKSVAGQQASACPHRLSANLSTRWSTGIASAAMAVALLLGMGCQKKDAAPATMVTVQAATAALQSITAHITGDAVLSPLAQAAIAPKITAPVRTYYVQRGSKVRQGELLAVLENKDLAAARMDNQGGYTQAQAVYQTTTKAAVPEELQRAQLDVSQAKANLDLQQKIFDARQKLFSEGAIPGRDLDTARAQLVQARSAYDIAASHLAGLRSVSNKAALESAKGQLQSAEGKFKGAEAQYSYSEIRSPINGVVTDRPLFPGETAQVGMPLLTVMDTSALLAKTHLPQSQVQTLKLGAVAEVSVPGIEKPIPGKVTLISPALDPGSTTVEVWVRIENPKGEIKAGTSVRVSIAAQTIPDALIAPTEAVVTSTTGQKTVMVIGADSIAHARPIGVGISDGDDIQIITGLKAGEQVVTVGAYGMDDGTPVKVGVAGADEDAPGAKSDAKPDAGKTSSKDGDEK